MEQKTKKLSFKMPLFLIGIGVIMITLGFFYGGWHDMEVAVKSSPVARFTHFSLSNPFSRSNKAPVSTADSFDADKVRSLDIDLDGADIVFSYSSDDTINISTKNSTSASCYLDDDTLFIQSKNDSFSSSTVTINMPKNIEFDNVNIVAGALSMESVDIECNSVNIEIGAGETAINKLKVKDTANFTLGAGDLTIASGDVNKMNVDLSMGNFEYTGKIKKSFEGDLGMGNASLVLKADQYDYNYNLDASMGQVALGNTSQSGIAQSVNIDNNKKKYIDISCGMGNIEIAFD